MISCIHHLRRQNAGRAVERWEGFVELCHTAANRRLLLHNVDLIAGLCDIQCRLNAGNTAADNQRTLHHLAFAWLQRSVEAHLSDSGLSQFNRLSCRFLLILQYPGALLTDIGNLYHVGINPHALRAFAEGCLVHTRRAAAHNKSVQLIICYSLANQLLPLLRAHIFIIDGIGNVRNLAYCLNHLGNIYRAGDVAATPTNKNTYLLHVASPYLLYFLNAATKSCCGISLG